MEILQIVPKLPPAISGVGDYALLLARRLRAAHDIRTSFIVCDPSCEVGQDLDGFSVDRIDTRRPDDLERRIGAPGMPATVVLHYVGYGYQKRGCPFWLVRGLESWKKRDADRRLLVMFHELYASGPCWRSSFWTSPLQRGLVKSLALLSEHCVTNQRVSRESLEGMTLRPESHFSVLPVFSNVGEPDLPACLAGREPRMIVFGSAAWRRQAYHEQSGALVHACRELGITEVADIGPRCGDIPKLAVRCATKGSLPAELVGREMRNARAGFFTYPAPCLGKSSIFAAYAAHGLLPVTYAENSAENKDGVRPNEHYLPVSPSYRCNAQHVENVAREAHAWYEGHEMSVQAMLYAGVIRGVAHAGRGEIARLCASQSG